MVTTEERLSRLEGAYEQADGRLGDISRSIEAMRTETNQSIESLRREMNSRINNLYILIGGSWVTLVIMLIGLYFRG